MSGNEKRYRVLLIDIRTNFVVHEEEPMSLKEARYWIETWDERNEEHYHPVLLPELIDPAELLEIAPAV